MKYDRIKIIPAMGIMASWNSWGKKLKPKIRSRANSIWIKNRYFNQVCVPAFLFKKNTAGKTGAKAQRRLRFSFITPWLVKNQRESMNHPNRPVMLKRTLSIQICHFLFWYSRKVTLAIRRNRIPKNKNGLMKLSLWSIVSSLWSNFWDTRLVHLPYW